MATIYSVRDALLELSGVKVYHFTADEQRPDKYIIWAETAVNLTLEADDEPRNVVAQGLIYYYTNEEYDTTVNELVRVLIAHGVGISISNVGWDYTLRQLVYEITWNVGWELDNGTGEIY